MILNHQRRVRVSIPPLIQFLTVACKHLRLPADSLTVALVTNNQIARWNAAYRGKKMPTDVLSFPMNGSLRNKSRRNAGRKVRPSRARPARDDASATGTYLGDIAIAPAVARRNALRFGRTLDAEMRILILHGVLHLMGYDHETDAGEMDRRETRLRRKLGLA
jgi:probable rRNA maturation factor